jgi:uncharacterized membrane protein YhaH (DUF805 family)
LFVFVLSLFGVNGRAARAPFWTSVGKFRDFVAAVAVLCVVLAANIWASVGKFHDFVAAVAVCVCRVWVLVIATTK